MTASQPACLPACPPACLPACLPVCPSASPPANRPVYGAARPRVHLAMGRARPNPPPPLGCSSPALQAYQAFEIPSAGGAAGSSPSLAFRRIDPGLPPLLLPALADAAGAAAGAATPRMVRFDGLGEDGPSSGMFVAGAPPRVWLANVECLGVEGIPDSCQGAGASLSSAAEPGVGQAAPRGSEPRQPRHSPSQHSARCPAPRAQARRRCGWLLRAARWCRTQGLSRRAPPPSGSLLSTMPTARTASSQSAVRAPEPGPFVQAALSWGCRGLARRPPLRPTLARARALRSAAGGSKQSIQISQLPPRTRLDTPWARQKVALRAAPRHIALYPQAGLFAVLCVRQASLASQPACLAAM